MKKALETYEMYTRLWSENIKGRNHFKYTILCRRIILKYVLKKYGVSILVGFIWIRTGIIGGFL
jgi:hypothetical protein